MYGVVYIYVTLRWYTGEPENAEAFQLDFTRFKHCRLAGLRIKRRKEEGWGSWATGGRLIRTMVYTYIILIRQLQILYIWIL